MFIWKDEYSVTIREFDNQHRKLVSLLNRLFDAMNRGQGKDVVGHILDDLIQYTVVHFDAEEKAMGQHGYPDLVKHRQEHELLKRQVLDFKSEFDAGRKMISVQVMNFLKDWLIDHINGTDKAYGPFLKEKGLP